MAQHDHAAYVVELSKRIRDSGISIADIARISGMSYNTVKYVANGTNKNPTVKTVDAIDAAWWKSVPVKLRDYQDDIIIRTRESLRTHNAPLIVLPTGGGKTALTVTMMANAAERGKRSYFCVHRDTLLNQTSRALWQQHLEHGMIAAGRTMTPRADVQVASVQTLVRRLARAAPPDLIVVDEAHRATAATYRKILDAYPNSKVVGLTATPQRTDGKGLSAVFDDLVIGPSFTELQSMGYLCGYELLAPESSVDMTGVSKRGGDYATEDVERIVDKPTITGDAVKTYLQHARGKRCVVFCASLKHAQHVCDAYNANGVAAEYMDGSTSSSEREEILNRLDAGNTQVLVNVELVIEGVDVPGIEAVQWLRPTASLIIWMQGNGRGFRPSNGKSGLLIMDHVNNWQRHGLPDDDREWSLEGSKKRGRGKKQEREINARQCPKCFSVFRPVNVCPSCGHHLTGDGREVEHVDGELVKIDREKFRREQKREQSSARTLSDLVELGVRRGQKKPAEWAAFVYAARHGGRKPTQKEFQEARKVKEGLI